MISSSDWVYIICTFCIIVTALTAPYLNDLWKRKSLAPKLKIIFFKEFPYITHPPNESIFLLCFEVKNYGVSAAKDCEVIIEEFFHRNEEGNLIKDNRNFPAKLGWVFAGNDVYSPIDILPKTGNFFKMCSITGSNEPKYQNKIILTTSTERMLRFASSSIQISLKYLKMKIVVYSENAEKCEQYVEIESPGIWKKSKDQIFQDMKIKLS